MISAAKINLGLNVLYKREDGYHEIQSVFIRINWGDEISFFPDNSGKITLTSKNELGSFKRESFEAVCERGDFRKNILFKAYTQISDIIGFSAGIHIQLTKKIPTGGGLGGGSSNAASLIRYMLNQSSVVLTEALVQKISKIGADIPFFLTTDHALVGGIGEKILPIKISPGFGVLAIPDVSINTSELYSQLKKPLQKAGTQNSWDKLEWEISDSLRTGNWKFLQEKLKNEFEEPVFRSCPELAVIKKNFLKCGAEYSSMTGSGSCLYALTSKSTEQIEIHQKMQRLHPEMEMILFEF